MKPKQKKNDMFVGRCAVSRTVDSLQIKSCAIYTPDLVPFIWDPLGFFGIFWDYWTYLKGFAASLGFFGTLGLI